MVEIDFLCTAFSVDEISLEIKIRKTSKFSIEIICDFLEPILKIQRTLRFLLK